MKCLFTVFALLFSGHVVAAAQTNQACDFPIYDIPGLDKNIAIETPVIRFIVPNQVVFFGENFTYDASKVKSSIDYSSGVFFTNWISRKPYGQDIVFSTDGCKISGSLPMESLNPERSVSY